MQLGNLEETPAPTPNEPAKRVRRRKLIIDPSLQFAILGFAAAMTMISTAFGYLVARILMQPQLIPEFGAPIAHWLMGISCMILLLIFITFGVWALIVSHRVAGPLYRLRGQMNDILAGRDVPPLTFRKGDQFHDIAEMFNQIMEMKHASRVASVQQSHKFQIKNK